MTDDAADGLREDFILLHFGEEIMKLVTLLQQTGQLDEFTLAEKFGANVNHTRSLLYSLYEWKIVSYSRERDKERMWWIYSWVLDASRIDELILKEIEKELQELGEKKRKLGGNQFFECKGCGERYSFERAFELNFFCSSCGDFLTAVDVAPLAEDIDERMGLLNSRAETMRNAIAQDKEIEDKRKAKAQERIAKKAAKKKAAEKEEKKKQTPDKKPPKKKPAPKKKRAAKKKQPPKKAVSKSKNPAKKKPSPKKKPAKKK